MNTNKTISEAELLKEFDVFFSENSRVDIYSNRQIFFKKLEQSLKDARQAGEEQALESEIEFLERLKLEVDVNVCKCGEEWSETDIANLINTKLKQRKGE